MKTSISTPLRLYLIRHGETEWSLNRRQTGRTDIPLTANGESEARELGKHLWDIRFSYVLTSTLKRAQQTCALVGLDQVPEIEPDLVEWDYGDYEGKQSVDSGTALTPPICLSFGIGLADGTQWTRLLVSRQ